MGDSLKSIENLMEDSVHFINDQINSIDWNKKWRNDYPRTEIAKAEFESLKKPEVKEAINEVFDEKSLAIMNLSEVF